MLKTVSNQSKAARLLYGRSEQDNDHSESSNSMSWLDPDNWQDAAGHAMGIMHENTVLLSLF